MTPEQDAAIEKIAKIIVRFGLTVPAILALESMRPVAYVSSQLMHLLTPSIGVVLSTTDWEALSAVLADRRGVEVLIARVEAVDRTMRGGGDGHTGEA